ncbi:MAG TPA: hypothetical protein PLI16_04765 [Bacteroidales bacterium]|nr:hypothetical protein [Bacteroidales bacterium]HOH83903.1 hypothetical protein [Bacteroidales bacterium]
MKKHLLVILLIFTVLLATGQQKHVVTYPDGKVHYEYETKNGLLDGPFVSYYENGNKKAEGKYVLNQRKGQWKVWDSRGLRRAERVYGNSFDYRITGLWDSTGNKCKVRQKATKKYSTVDPAFGYVPYYPVTEKEVLWCKRLWREIPADSLINQQLFLNNRLFGLIMEAIMTNKISAFRDEEYEHALPYDSVQEYKNLEVACYRIKEDFFFNKTLSLTEYRTIGIGPAMKKSGKTKTLFWLYYPEIRGLLASQQPETETPNTMIPNYESLFFKRYYHSIIYKESNVYDREIKDYKKGKDIGKEAEIIELTAIDLEFEWWYNNTCPCKK